MLGQLTGLFREGSVFKYANHYLNVEYKLSKNIPLGQLTDIRNKCTHDPNYQPTLEELSFFVSHLKILISEMGYAETIKIKKQKKENILDKILRSNKKLQVIILFFGLIFSLLKGVEEVLPIFLPNQPVYQVPDKVKKENSDNQILTDLNKSYRIMVNEKPVYDSNSGLTFSLSYVQAELFSFFQLTWSSGILSNQEAIKKGSRIVIKNDDISYIINILSINKEKQSIEISIVKSETLL